jgi:drug/metabolite transporter (DMT)-like permease
MHTMKSSKMFLRSINPIFVVLFGAFLISFSAVWVKLAGVPSTTSAFYRVFFGFLFLVPITLYSGELKKYNPARTLPILLCGTAFALDLFFWHASILYIGPGLATILGNFQVFLMAACGYFFFKEKLKLRYILSLPLAFTGLFLVIGNNWQMLSASYKLGIALGLMTAVCYTIYLLLLRRIQSEKDEPTRFTPLMLISLSSTVCLALMIMLSGGSFAIPTISAAVSLLCLGLLSQAVGWLLIANALPKIHASLTGLILLLQPSLSFIWDVLFFSRPTSPLNWLGAAITVTAIYMGLTGRTRR